MLGDLGLIAAVLAPLTALLVRIPLKVVCARLDSTFALVALPIPLTAPLVLNLLILLLLLIPRTSLPMVGDRKWLGDRGSDSEVPVLALGEGRTTPRLATCRWC